MALGATNITTAAVQAELGLSASTPRQVSALCAYSGQNPFSFYGTGTIGVDANKTAIWTPPSSNYKLGDFRYYNHTASTPAPPTSFTHYWGPSGTTTNVTLVSFPSAINVLFINSSATYITYKAYLSTTDRANETNLFSSYTTTWSGSTISQLAGHTRTQTYQINSTLIGSFPSFPTTGLTDPDYVYFDVYLSNSSGTRLINMGSSVSGAYFTVTFRKNKNPQTNSSGNCVSRTGYTGTFTAVGSSSTRCSSAVRTQTLGSTFYSFYLTAVGIQTVSYNIYPTNCVVTMYTYDGGGSLKDTTVVASGVSLNQTTAKYFSGNKAVSWAYNDYGIVSVTSVSTWGTAYAC